MRLSIHWTGGRGEQLQKVAPEAKRVWNSGGAVAVHCVNCSHRGPLTLAVVLKVVYGIDTQRTIDFIASNCRQIWSGHHASNQLDPRYLDH